MPLITNVNNINRNSRGSNGGSRPRFSGENVEQKQMLYDMGFKANLINTIYKNMHQLIFKKLQIILIKMNKVNLLTLIQKMIDLFVQFVIKEEMLMKVLHYFQKIRMSIQIVIEI